MIPDLTSLPLSRPVLIAGPTAAGKSALALLIAQMQGRSIVNADALQIYANWRILSARPSPEDHARVPHRLYGHIQGDQPYSVGHWLRDVAPFLAPGDQQPMPVIVGGTGLNFSALTEGLAEIPPTPPEIRAQGDQLSHAALLADLDVNDPVIAARIDRQNRARVQRAWEVFHATGRALSSWQAETPPPLVPPDQCCRFVVSAGRDWLAERIARRVDLMLATGALDEARANLPGWSPDLPSAKCIGAAELIAHVSGSLSLKDARTAIVIATRQYAKRQRTWFRARMQGWTTIVAENL